MSECFFFSSRRRHTRWTGDWSSDVCSSDLLHEQVIDDCSTIDTQSRHMNATISSHHLLYIAGLIAHRFKSGTSNMASGRTARQANDSTTCIGIPVGSTQADKGRYEVDAAVIRNRSCQRFNIDTVFDDTEAVTQPLNCRTSNEDSAFQAISDLSVYTPANGSQETTWRGNAFGTCVHEHKITRAEGVLRHTYLVTGLSKGSSLLISCIASHFNRPTEEFRVGFTVDSAGWLHLG